MMRWLLATALVLAARIVSAEGAVPVAARTLAPGTTPPKIPGCAVTIAGAVNLLFTSRSLSSTSSAAASWRNHAVPSARARWARRAWASVRRGMKAR